MTESSGDAGSTESVAARADRLAAELHRLSNVLEVIAALLSYRGQQLTDPLARDQIEWAERVVQALMALTPSVPGAFGDGDHAMRQMDAWRAICAARSIELDVQADPLAIPVALQVTLALILNELMTNAVKHAFVGRARGHLRVDFRRLALDPPQAELVVADDGVGMPPEAARKGLGLSLLDRLAAGAGMSLRFETGPGVTARLRVPLG